MSVFDPGRIIRLRKFLELSETQFAKRIGVAQATYHRFEKGSANLNADAIAEILKNFNVDPTWLLLGEGGDDPVFSNKMEISNRITITKDEFIALQGKALRQEDRIRELEGLVEELRKG